MCDIRVIPVGLKDWAVCSDGRLVATCSNQTDAHQVAEGLAASQTVLNLYDHIFALEDVIEELQDVKEKSQ